MAEDNRATFPIYTRVVAFEPIMSEVNILLTKIHYRKVNTLAMSSNCHQEFYELCDIPALVAGSISIVDRDWD